MKVGIAHKALILLLFVFACSTLAAIRFTQRAILNDHLQNRREHLREIAITIDEAINSIPHQTRDPELIRIMDMLASEHSGRIIISDLSGKIYYDSKRLRTGLNLQQKEELQITGRKPDVRLLLRISGNQAPVYFPVGKLAKFLDRLEDVSLIYFAPLAGQDEVIGQVMIVEPVALLGPSIEKVRNDLVLFMIVMFAAASAVTLFFTSRNIVRPIMQLSELSKKVARKEFKDRVEFRSGDEIGEVGRHFNTMVYNLDKVIRGLEDQNEGLMHLSGELESRNEELNRKQQLIDFDLRLAHNIQQELLPQIYPKIEGVLISAANFQVGEIGGDCFDFYKLREKRLGAFIGDVSGKGIAAALVMSMVTILFSQLKDRFDSPSQILGHVNEIMYRHFGSQHSIYLTCFFLSLDVNSMTLAFSCAGHTPPLLFRPNTGEMMNLEAEGFGLGMFTNVSYEEKKMKIVPGDKIILFTDGVTDCRNPAGEMFGHERLEELIKKYPEANSYRLTHFIVEELEEFAGKAARQDDLTLLIIEVQENSVGRV